MKNIIKELWSCWNNIDRFVAIISTIAIIALMCIFCTSCNAQTSVNNIPSTGYYDASGEMFDEELDCDGAILFSPVNIIDFIYHAQDNEYVIEYDDADVFDPDNMLFNKSCGCYFIEIYCDSNLFFDYLVYYSTLTNKDDEFHDYSNEYFIEEEYLTDGTMYYKLVRYAKDN